MEGGVMLPSFNWKLHDAKIECRIVSSNSDVFHDINVEFCLLTLYNVIYYTNNRRNYEVQK